MRRLALALSDPKHRATECMLHACACACVRTQCVELKLGDVRVRLSTVQGQDTDAFITGVRFTEPSHRLFLMGPRQDGGNQ